MARLRHVDCAGSGLTRRRRGKGFSYLDEKGRPVHDEEVLDRIRGLAIPPAWRDVWVCPDERGHLQAVGTDDAGRRQYLYHPAWRKRRDREKFDHMLEFASALPAARRRIDRLLGEAELSRERVLSLAVALLDRGLFRVGGDEYTNEHGSHGLSTLERRHVQLGRNTVLFAFQGKSGQHQEIEVSGRALRRAAAELLRSRRRGPRFLAYRDSRSWHEVRSEDVNGFLKELVGDEFSAKDFRTWHATVLAAWGLAAAGPVRSATARRRVVAETIEEVAVALGNTPAVCRTSYIDPRVFDLYRAGDTIDSSLLAGRRPPSAVRQQAAERAVLHLLGEG